MELIAIAGTVVAFVAVIIAGVVAFRPAPGPPVPADHAGSVIDPEVLRGIDQRIDAVKAQVEQLERLVNEQWLDDSTYVQPSNDRLEEQVYFTLRGVIAASAAGQPMRRVFYPGAVRCDDAEKRAVLIRELDMFLQTVTAHRVGGRHREGSWHFRFHIYTTLRFDEFTKKLAEKLCGYLKDKQSLPLAKIMSSDQAAYLQIGPVVLVRTGFDFHATVLNEQGVTEFASRSRLDLDPSLILGELKEHTTAHFSLVRPNRREHDPCLQPD